MNHFSSEDHPTTKVHKDVYPWYPGYKNQVSPGHISANNFDFDFYKGGEDSAGTQVDTLALQEWFGIVQLMWVDEINGLKTL